MISNNNPNNTSDSKVESNIEANIETNVESNSFLSNRPQLARFLGWWKTNSLYIYLIIVIVSSFFTFFAIGRTDNVDKDKFCFPKIENTCFLEGYKQPTSLFWDENYHIVSAQKYLHGQFFMEPHPPLGKLLIALGEKIINPNSNINTDKLALGTNEGDSLPYTKSLEVSFKDGYTPKSGEVASFDFRGVRFFPVVMAWLSAILLFGLLYLLTKNQHIAFLFSLGYIFDNTIIVHSRGAMIDGIQLFFILCALCYFVYIIKYKSKPLEGENLESEEKPLENDNYNTIFSNTQFAILGMFIGLAVATKVNGLIIAPISAILIGIEIWNLPKIQKNYIIKNITILVSAVATAVAVNYFANMYVPTPKVFEGITDQAVIDFIKTENWNKVLPFYIFNVVSIIFILIASFVIATKIKIGEKLQGFDKQEIIDKTILWITKIVIFGSVVFGIFCGAYYIHFAVANTFVENNKYPNYVNAEYKSIVERGATTNASNFATQLKAHLWYTSEFQKGVPKYDPTKGENEAGSLPYTWPVGNHPIRYLANKYSKCNVDTSCVVYFSYLYLIPNILVWILAFVGVLLGLILIIGRIFFGTPILDKSKFLWIGLFSSMYVVYMLVMSTIDRVMYLYHYFLPLIFGLITASLVFDYFFSNKNKKWAITTGVLLGIGIITVFVIFAPFTYRLDLTDKDFAFRNWSKYWALMLDWK